MVGRSGEVGMGEGKGLAVDGEREGFELVLSQAIPLGGEEEIEEICDGTLTGPILSHEYEPVIDNWDVEREAPMKAMDLEAS